MGVYTWHAAKLRLTGILFPSGEWRVASGEWRENCCAGWPGSPDQPVLCDRCRRGAWSVISLSLASPAIGRCPLLPRHSPLATRHSPPPSMPRAELGIQGLKSWGRNWYRKVRETRSSSSQERPEPAAHPCRGPGGQAGDWHGGSPSFKGTRGRGTRVPVPATGSGEPLGTDAEPGPSLSDGVPGPSHPPGGCSVTRPPTCRVTKPRAWSRTPILNRFASLLAGG